jgi:hypothetical protein
MAAVGGLAIWRATPDLREHVSIPDRRGQKKFDGQSSRSQSVVVGGYDS